MRAVVIDGDDLCLDEIETPRPRKDQVLIKTHAAGVNRPDILQRIGAYPPPSDASPILGLEVAGTIIAMGPQTRPSALNIGDNVCALISGGGYAEYCTAHIGACLPIGDILTLTQAAAIPETLFTVWFNLVMDAKLRKGERVLVHGATSGIGTMAIALANHLGAEIITTASTPTKRNAALKLGAHAALDYTADDWPDQLRALGKVDVVLDMAGGDFVAKNLACLRSGGRHVSIAVLRGARADIPIFSIMKKRLRLSGSTLRNQSDEVKAQIAKEIADKIWPAFVAGTLKPVLDSEFALADAAAAHERMKSGAHIGKIVLRP